MAGRSWVGQGVAQAGEGAPERCRRRAPVPRTRGLEIRRTRPDERHGDGSYCARSMGRCVTLAIARWTVRTHLERRGCGTVGPPVRRRLVLMPTYEYACKTCGEHLEVVQSFKDDPLTECPACGGPLRKVFGSIGHLLQGQRLLPHRQPGCRPSRAEGRDRRSRPRRSPKTERRSRSPVGGPAPSQATGGSSKARAPAAASGGTGRPRGPTRPRAARRAPDAFAPSSP